MKPPTEIQIRLHPWSLCGCLAVLLSFLGIFYCFGYWHGQAVSKPAPSQEQAVSKPQEQEEPWDDPFKNPDGSERKGYVGSGLSPSRTSRVAPFVFAPQRQVVVQRQPQFFAPSLHSQQFVLQHQQQVQVQAMPLQQSVVVSRPRSFRTVVDQRSPFSRSPLARLRIR